MLRLYSHFNNVIIFLKKRSSYGQRPSFSEFSIAIIIQHRNHFFGPNCSFKNIIYIIAKVLSDTSKIDISHSHDIEGWQLKIWVYEDSEDSTGFCGFSKGIRGSM